LSGHHRGNPPRARRRLSPHRLPSYTDGVSGSNGSARAMTFPRSRLSRHISRHGTRRLHGRLSHTPRAVSFRVGCNPALGTGYGFAPRKELAFDTIGHLLPTRWNAEAQRAPPHPPNEWRQGRPPSSASVAARATHQQKTSIRRAAFHIDRHRNIATCGQFEARICSGAGQNLDSRG